MGHIQEPEDIDLLVGPSKLTDKIKHRISQAIKAYKAKAEQPAAVKPLNAEPAEVL